MSQNCDIVTFGNVTKCHTFRKYLVQSYVYLLCLDPARNYSKHNFLGPIWPGMQFNSPMNHGKILKGWPLRNALRNYCGTKHF